MCRPWVMENKTDHCNMWQIVRTNIVIIIQSKTRSWQCFGRINTDWYRHQTLPLIKDLNLDKVHYLRTRKTGNGSCSYEVNRQRTAETNMLRNVFQSRTRSACCDLACSMSIQFQWLSICTLNPYISTNGHPCIHQESVWYHTSCVSIVEK